MAIEIVDFPINSMVIFHCELLVHQRVCCCFFGANMEHRENQSQQGMIFCFPRIFFVWGAPWHVVASRGKHMIPEDHAGDSISI